MSPQEVHQQLQCLRRGDAPMPMTRGQAEKHAARLRTWHMLSYPDLAKVMGIYHGDWRSADTWRHHCRRHGVPHRKVMRPHMFGYEEPIS